MSDFSLVLACRDCDATGIVFDDPDKREQAVHGHVTAPYAVRSEHPDRGEGDTTSFPTGSTVTFWGSTTGSVADYVQATVDREADNVTSDGDAVKGYVVTVDGWHLFAPATALHVADAPPAA